MLRQLVRLTHETHPFGANAVFLLLTHIYKTKQDNL